MEPLMSELVVHFGSWSEQVPLDKTPVVIGRAEDCDVQIPDGCLSRHHCRIFPAKDGAWLVEDLGSLGGTLLDGAAVKQPARLRPGARLKLGESVVVFESGSTTSVLSADLARDPGKVRLLLETVGDLYGSAGLDELLRTVVDRAIRVAGADRGALLLAGPEAALEVAVARNAAGRELQPDQLLTRSLPSRALETGRAVVLTDTEASGQRQQATASVLDGGLRSVLCVPLPGAGGPVGVLYVDGFRPAEDFGPADLAIFEALAVQAALAIERARLREQQAQRERDERKRLESENAALRAGIGPAAPLGESPAMRKALEQIRRVALSDATVCLTGETGSGKEVLARYLHQLSPRARGPFVVVDCGAIPESLIESELFGHEKGSFTGAVAARAGRFREAQGGTVFLDEIGELPLALQTRLLRVLQERTVQPVGGTGPVPIDVRVVCATHQDLRRKVETGQFRQDLYYRIAVLTIPVPALRERGGDIQLLARHFLIRSAGTYGMGLTGFTREAVEALLAHSWPGNVRELEHRVQRAVLFATPPFVTRRDLGLGDEKPEGAGAPVEAELVLPTLPEARAKAYERFERAYLEEALQRTRGHVPRAAKLAGVSRQMIQKLIQKHSIDPRRFQAQAST
jgi:transcriptional regulator with GAF, ATPase, and Fis domain